MPEVTVTASPTVIATNTGASNRIARVRNADATVSVFIDTASNVTASGGAHGGYELKAGVDEDFTLAVGDTLYAATAAGSVRVDVVIS